MSSNINVLQVIPKLGYGGAETGCYDIAHYLSENNCKSFIVTSGGELIKFIAQMPNHVCINELTISPTLNRGYVAQARGLQKV